MPGRAASIAFQERVDGMLYLRNSNLDGVKLANGVGVEAAQATTLEQCADLMELRFWQSGPFLIKLLV